MPNRLRIYFGIFIVALITLMMELTLTRVFEVIISTNIAYMVITCAMFSIGLAGVYRTLRPMSDDPAVFRPVLATYALLVAISTLLFLPVMNALPFDPKKIFDAPFTQVLAFFAMYLVLIVPFFFLGMIFVTLFSVYAKNIQRLYFWDLVGAGIGCIVLVPFLPVIGPGGLLFLSAALALVASGLFAAHRGWTLAATVFAMAVIAIPFAKYPDYFEFRAHWNKRDVAEDIAKGNREFSRWDPISKIDVIDKKNRHSNPPVRSVINYKHIAYDGGMQSSRFFPLDTDLATLRRRLELGETDVENHFWHWGVIASHSLKRDQGQGVLIIGSAGGQEIKGALMYGAGHVDAIEMVGTVLDLAKNQYNDYTGHIFDNPNLTLIKGEGRSFLRSTDKKYDIIQIFSNFTSSAIAAGTGAMATTYLQTADAYREYFSHLTDNGILHINHLVYPKMVATAALAWKQLGLPSALQDHVVVVERAWIDQDNNPTVLIKMSPWTVDDLKDVRKSLSITYLPYEIVVDPTNPKGSFLSKSFFTGQFPPELAATIPFRITPTTDDRPYFNFYRKRLAYLEPNPAIFVNRSTANMLNQQFQHGVPLDIIHLIITAVVSTVFVAAFIFVPMFFSSAGKANWTGKPVFLIYFTCLGFGFIVFELVFIQIFMKLIGYPLYTYSTVIFTMLLSAGIGSLCSERMRITTKQRWSWPFIGIGISGAALLLAYPILFDVFLVLPTMGRILVAAALLFPLGFFLGMPFPLGILALQGMPTGAVAWAWALNAVFTVVGGYLSIVASIYIGFRLTFLAALVIYGVALWAFSRMRKLEVRDAVAAVTYV